MTTSTRCDGVSLNASNFFTNENATPGLAGMSADKKNSFQSALGTLKGKRHYASLFFWPVFLLTQLFAMGFNTGLLAITLFKVASTDIAFGWQSTIQFSAEAIFHFVRVLALPWSWCVSSALAYPSLPEIEGSRIILKDGISYLVSVHKWGYFDGVINILSLNTCNS